MKVAGGVMIVKVMADGMTAAAMRAAAISEVTIEVTSVGGDRAEAADSRQVDVILEDSVTLGDRMIVEVIIAEK